MELRDKAIILRKNGTSLGDIALKLGIAKSTASLWCREVILSEPMKKKIQKTWLQKTVPARMAGTQANKQKKVDSINRAKQEALKILASEKTNRDLLIAGICLYWAEGSKSAGTSTFLFVNSDPNMILLIMKVMKKIFNCKSEDFVCSIQINSSHQHRITKVLKFWKNMLNLPMSQFRKPTYVFTPHKKVYANHDSYFGTMRLSIRKGRYLQYCMIELVKAFAPATLSG